MNFHWNLQMNLLLFMSIQTILVYIIASIVYFSKGPRFITPYMLYGTSALGVFNLVCSTVLLSYMIFSCTFLIFKNHFNKSKQKQRLCLLITFGNVLISIAQCSQFIWLYTWNSDDVEYGLIISLISGNIAYLYLAFFFSKASYSISEFTDIWDLDKVTSKFYLPSFTIWFVTSQVGLINFLNSIHVIPRYYYW